MKKIGVLGTGSVGTTITGKLLDIGYSVMLGSRDGKNKNVEEWIKTDGNRALIGDFKQTAEYGEILFFCVKGEIALTVAKSLNSINLKGKTLVDITNPLDFSKGMPPFLIPDLSNTFSLGEAVQKALPDVNVVKTLNTVTASLMISGSKNGENPTMFLCGNEKHAKLEVAKILKEFDWNDIIDLGDISAARGTEMLLPLWVRTMLVIGNPNFAFKVLK